MQLNYILGTNAHNISFVTGVGSKSVMHPHHRPSWADGILAPVPGLLAGGPNQYLNDDVLKRNFNAETPPALCYIDSVESYASNEIAINWNASLVFVLGYFNGEGLTSIDDQSSILYPQSFKLNQNYPNPFNPSTIISWQAPVSGWQTLKIYDALGREVATLVNEFRAAGNYEVEFNSAINNKQLASGVYYYQLRMENPANGTNFMETKKMIILK